MRRPDNTPNPDLTGSSLTGENRSRRLSTGSGIANSGRRLPIGVSFAGSSLAGLRGVICRSQPRTVTYDLVTLSACDAAAQFSSASDINLGHDMSRTVRTAKMLRLQAGTVLPVKLFRHWLAGDPQPVCPSSAKAHFTSVRVEDRRQVGMKERSNVVKLLRTWMVSRYSLR